MWIQYPYRNAVESSDYTNTPDRSCPLEQKKRRAQPGAKRIRRTPSGLQIREEQLDLALGGVGGVRAVHDVLLHLQRVVAADSPGPGRDGVGGPGQRAERFDGALALDHHGDQRPAGDELDERGEERPLAVLLVVRLGGVGV